MHIRSAKVLLPLLAPMTLVYGCMAAGGLSADARKTGGPTPWEGGDPTGAEPVAPEPTVNWVQLSTDDSTSMASAQMYKAGFRGDALKTHEFVNYYDPPENLFEAEGFPFERAASDSIKFGIKAHNYVESASPADGAGTADEPSQPASKEIAEVLFQMRADLIGHEARRNWNIFLCVDVSGSMTGEKIAFVRNALATMLSHFKEGDRLTLVTFDSDEHLVFEDLEVTANLTRIKEDFAALDAGSATNMIAGLNLAYNLAQKHFRTEMLQRVLLFSDGAANVGDTDIATFAQLTRINNQEGIYLSGIGVGNNYDWQRMDQLTDAGKGAHVFLPNLDEVSLIFGDYLSKLIEVAADSVAIEMELPQGIELESFSGEDVSTDPNDRLQNIILAAGDDMTFVARFVIAPTADVTQPANLKVSLRPLDSGEEQEVEVVIPEFKDLFAQPGALFKRTRIVDRFAKHVSGAAPDSTPEEIRALIASYADSDWGLVEIDGLLQARP